MVRKVLFVGLGSAGQRHLRNLLKLSGKDIEISAYRSRKNERVFSPDMKIIENETLAGKYGIREFYDYEKALDERPDVVVIANPNSMHVPYALTAAQRGIDLFIEKPLSTSLERTKELAEIVEEKKIICQVGFQYRYHPCVRLMKEYLDKGKVGQPVLIHAEVGERISRMHSYEDYRNMLEAHKHLGGGVVLCQVHELDYLSWVLGEPESLYSIGGSKGGFEMNVEDTATTILRYKRECSEFAVMIHQDFIQYPPVRRCKRVGADGRMEADLFAHSFVYEDYKTEKSFKKVFNNLDRNDMFLAELKDFLECVESRKRPVCDVYSALTSTKIGLAIRKSFEEKREIGISEFCN